MKSERSMFSWFMEKVNVLYKHKNNLKILHKAGTKKITEKTGSRI